MKKLLSLILIVFPSLAFAQTVNFEDDFSDQDISDWSGDTGNFTFTEENGNILLQQDAPGAGSSYLSIPSTDIQGYWEFFVRMEFSPSDGNKAEIYLMSDSQDLTGALNGYKLLAGENGSGDVFRLFRIDNGSEALEVLTGTTDISAGGDFRVKVTRDSSGNWTLEVAEGYAGVLSIEDSGTDNTYTTASHFGFRTTYTSTRVDLFAFDFKIDIPPIEVSSVETISETEIDVTFSRAIDFGTAQTSDFTLNPGSTNPHSVTQQNIEVARITFPSPIPSGQNELTISNINDANGETTLADTTFSFFIYDEYQPGDIIINEFMYNQPSGATEYVEVYNTSDRYLNLKDWELGDNGAFNPISVSDLTIEPNSFIVLTDDGDLLTSYFGAGNYAELSSWRALNNTGSEQVRIRDESGITRDSLEYTSDWGGNGVALERRDPDVSTAFQENWGDSPADNFGTPGFSNQVQPDTTPPELANLVRIGNDQIQLIFSERLQQTSAENTANFDLDADNITGIPGLQTATFSSPDTVLLQYDAELPSQPAGTTYELTIANQSDIFGNTASGISTTFFVIEYAEADSGQVFITEFMSDPAAEFTDFIELYNPTENAYNLQGWTYNDNSGDRRTIINNEFTLPPDSYLIITPDSTISELFPEIKLLSMGSGFANLNSTTPDDIVIRNQSGKLIDSLTYSTDWGGNEVSLERKSIDFPANIIENWGDSPSENFATPGAPNEILPDTSPPEITELIIQNSHTLVLITSERLENSSAETAGNYTLSQNPETGAQQPAIPGISSASQFAPDSVELNLDSNLEEYAGTWSLTAANLTDIFGNTGSEEIEFEFSNPFTIANVSAPSVSEILIEFTENPNFSTLAIEDFSVNDVSLDGTASLSQPEPDQILLDISTPLPSGYNRVSVTNIESVTGWNIPQNTSFEFFVFDEYQAGDVVINEFMYNQSSGTAEYIELKNTSGRFLNIKDWRIGDNQALTVISSQDLVVLPDSFIVISPDTAALRSFFGDAYYQQVSFPALNNNTPDQVRVFDATETMVDSLEYNSSWGGNGVALERRNATVSATFQENWGDSPSENLGTPGFTNLIQPDTTPPELTSITRTASDEVELLFSERILENAAQNSSNFSLTADNISENIPQIQTVTFSSPDTVLLRYDADLPSQPSGTTYELTIANQTDIFGNTAADTSTTFFVIEYAVADSGQVFITEFMSDPATGFTDFIELYNPTENAYNLQGWTYNDNLGNRSVIVSNEFALLPNSRVVLAPDNTITGTFPDISLIPMGSRFANLNSTTPDDIVIRNQNGNLIDSLTYFPDWGGDEVSLERRSIDFSPEFLENWGNSPSEDLATPGAPNEILPDTTPPEIELLTVLNDSTFQVIFSERIQSAPALDVSNYSLSEPEGLPSAPPDIESVQFQSPDTVIISFQSALPKQEQGSEYGLIVENQYDIFGNMASTLESSFFLIDINQAAFNEVVINEFMYDPGPEFSEFIELYNTTTKNFNLQNWTYNDNTGNRRVITDSNEELVSGSYVIIAPDSTVSILFPGIPIIVMGSRFSALNNGADDIVIRNGEGTLIDSLTYFSDWGGDEVSLERRSENAPSIYRENWGDSPSSNLATPAAQNEAQPDNDPPEITNAFITAADSIRITFNERVDSVQAVNSSNYTFNASISISHIAKYTGNALILILNTPLSDGQAFTLTVENQEDIFGNQLGSVSVELEFTEFSPAGHQDVIVNEILYRRESSGSEEFVELYNRTNRNFNLSNWIFADASGSTIIPEGTQLKGGEYLILTDLESFANEVSGVYLSGFPTLNDDEDAVIIRNQQGTLIDSLFYKDVWGGNQSGVSLERKDPNAPSNDASNWASNGSENGNSAGFQSTVYEPDETPPEILFSRLQSNGSIFVAFTEFVDINNASALVNDQPASIIEYNEANANIVILENPGGVSALAKSKMKSSQALNLSFTDITDFNGNANEQLSVEVSQPLTPGAVVVNEILYNPLANADDNLPDQTEYIELYNRADYAISLEGFTLHDEPDENDQVRSLVPVSSQYKWIPAGGYVVVYAENEATTFRESQLAEYFDLQNESDQFKARIDRTSLSLANSDDAIYLADSTGATIDSVFYDESWQNPNLFDTDGVALERIDPQGPSNDQSNWSSSTRVSGGTPGEQNSIFQEGGSVSENTGITFTPNPFSPDGDGFDDNLFINYKLDESDYLLRIRIFDRYGREVRELADGLQAGFEGSLIWDGRTDDNRNNRVGIYIVLFEAYNSANGKNVTFKETVVLARKF